MVFFVEITALPEGFFGHVDIENDIFFVVNVGHQAIWSPKKAVGVHTVTKGFTVSVLLRGQFVAVVLVGRTPMESGSKLI